MCPRRPLFNATGHYTWTFIINFIFSGSHILDCINLDTVHPVSNITTIIQWSCASYCLDDLHLSITVAF